jgi:hypothetical protein
MCNWCKAKDRINDVMSELDLTHRALDNVLGCDFSPDKTCDNCCECVDYCECQAQKKEEAKARRKEKAKAKREEKAKAKAIAV